MGTQALGKTGIISNHSKPRLLSYSLGFFGALLLLGALAFQLDASPAIDWDEGWTFTVGQNWSERGFYGRSLDGAPAPPGLEASFPVVNTVALAYRVFGVGVWQGRVPAVVTMALTLTAFFFLVRQLFGFRLAWATLFVAVLMLPHPHANAFWMARQMFAEPLMLLGIVVGFLGILWMRTHSRWFILLAILGWSVGLFAKTQAQPFALLALGAIILFNLLNHRRQEALWLLAVSLGAVLGWRMIGLLSARSIAGRTLPITILPEALTVFGFVMSPEMRLTAVIVALLVGTPIILGIVYFPIRRVQLGQFLNLSDRDDDVRLALWVLAAAWLLWFVGAAHAGIVRYIFPALFFGAPFAALMLSDFTNGFDVRRTLWRIRAPLRERAISRSVVAAWLAFLLVIFYVPLTLSISSIIWNSAQAREVTAVTTFLNRETSPAARVETYESPLFLGLERSYHYPPDALHLELNKRAARLPAMVDYDPLQSNPDFLVVGPTGRTWKLYDDVIHNGAFRLRERFEQYEIYERVRR